MARASLSLGMTSTFWALAFCVIPALTPAQETVGGKKVTVKLVWSATATKSYDIQYESAIGEEFVKRVTTELEEILVQYTKLLKLTAKEKKAIAKNKFKVQFLNNLNTFEQVGGDARHPGFYSPGSKTLVLLQRPYYQLIPTVYHEAFHQYIHFWVGDGVSIPTWFNEGMATYFEGMQRDKNRRDHRLDPKKIDRRKLRMAQEAVVTRTSLPLAKLINAPHKEFHAKEKEGLYYNQSFAVCYFLMKATKGKSALDFAKTLKTSKEKEGAIEAANAKIFGKERKNLKKLETSWKRYMIKVDPEGKD